MKLPAHEQLIQSALQTICFEFNFPVPSLEWSKSMTYTLGKAFIDPPRIRLSFWLNEEQAMETLRHELAHLAVHYEPKTIKYSAHGAMWKNWAARLGAIPKARSSEPPANLYKLPETYVVLGLVCSNCGEKFLRRRLKKDLYHTPCGTDSGKLNLVTRGTYRDIKNWISLSP